MKIRSSIFTFTIIMIGGFLYLPALLFSQGHVHLSGNVTDSSKKPLGFVTVHIYKQKDLLKPLTTTYTKQDGKFKFEGIDSGNHLLVFTHTGFAEKKQPVSINATSGNVELDPVQLSIAAGVLKEVSVKTQRPLVEQSDDKIIFNVEDDPTNKTETAIDILRKTPFVTVDGEDNVQVNGQRNFKVLLNGRETSMFARNLKEALKGFPGSLISKIEVITSPSAKYDGEGVGGVINIITKKKIVGYNGSISSFSRTLDRMNHFAVNGNAKIGKIGGSLFYGIGQRHPVALANFTSTVPIIPSVFTKRELDGTRKNINQWNFGNAEFSWEIDTLNTISTYANINSGTDKSVLSQTITTDYSNNGTGISYYTMNSRNENPGISAGTDYIKKFKKNKEREFSIRFLGEFGKSNSFMNSLQENPSSDRFIINNSIAKNNQYTLQTDYSSPLKNNQKLELGLKTILRRASSDFESLLKYDAATNYKINPANTDKFKYIQNVFSVYSMYSFKIKKTSFRIGGRAEHTTVNGDFITSNTLVKQSYTTLLPNIQSTKRLGKTITLVLSYSKRLQRPYIWDLNPFIFNNDSLDITYGNPGLDPQTIHILSAQTRFVKGSTFASASIEGGYSNDKILNYSSFDAATGITRTTSLNIGKEFQSRFNLNVNAKITGQWDVFVNASIRYIHIANNAKTSQSNQGFGSNFNMNNSYKFSNKFTITTFFGIWQDPVTIQTEFPLMLWYNVAFNHKFLKDKLNVSLRGVNFLEKTRDFRTVLTDPNFITTNINTQFRRGGVLALTWNFGKLTENVSKKKGVNNDDLLAKPQSSTPNN